MNITVELFELITIAAFLFAGMWTLLYRLVFTPLDKISTELSNVKEVFEPRITALEVKVKQLQGE